jgi:hypothetical protein
MLSAIKNHLLQRKIKQMLEGKERTVRIKSLKDMRSIAVLYDASNENNYSRANQLIRHFKGLKKEVMSMAFINFKDAPHYIETTITANFYLKSEVSWLNVPNSKFVDDFIKMDFDMLVDLNFDRNPSLYYILKTSEAHCKVGLRQPNMDNSSYDFMLESIDPTDISRFMKELLHYLELIKTS